MSDQSEADQVSAPEKWRVYDGVGHHVDTYRGGELQRALGMAEAVGGYVKDEEGNPPPDDT